jgi:ferredoxin
VGSGAGFNAYLIRTADAPFYATGTMKPRWTATWGLAITKSHFQDHRGKRFGGQGNGNNSLEADEAINERGIIRYATLDEYKANPGFANEGEGHEKTDKDTTMFPNWPYNEANAWGMSIDMNSCTGCNACIVSCYAENNIAVVGKQQVRIGRNMQWLRIDTYFRRRSIGAARPLPAHGLPALRERALRAGLPGGRDGAHAGRPEHHGL